MKCTDCDQEMTVKHESCICDGMVIDGTAYKRNTTYHDVNKYCHDCGILNGGVHHFGCDIEICPKCKEQAFCCDCDSDRYVITGPGLVLIGDNNSLRTERDEKIERNLEVCRSAAHHLKEQFPNQIMKIEKNTIIDNSKKNSRLLSKTGSMSGCLAYYTKKTPHRVVIKMKCLTDSEGWGYDGSNKYSLNPIMKECNIFYKYTPCKRCGLDLSRFNGNRLVTRKDYSLYTELVGDIALIELMCHELAHHKTKGHARGFKKKYKQFWDFMKSEIINGNFKVSDKDLKHLLEVIESQFQLKELKSQLK